MPQLGKSGLSLLPKHIIFSKRKTTGLQRLKNNKPSSEGTFILFTDIQILVQLRIY